MSLLIRRVFSIGLLMSLSACAALTPVTDAVDDLFSDSDNSEPPVELTEYQPEIKFDILWDESEGKGMDEQAVNLVPALTIDSILVADHDGAVFAHRLSDGELLWEIETDLAISAGPVIDGDLAFITTSNAQVIALKVDTGEAIWKQAVSSEILALPVVSKGMLLLRTIDGYDLALERATGKSIWQVKNTVPALSIRGDGSPVVDGESVIIGYANGKLKALNLMDGGYLWEASIAIPHGRSEIERLTDINGTPFLRNNTVYVSTYRSGLAAVATGEGDVLWRNEKLSSAHGMAADSRYLYVSDSSSDVWQLSQSNGQSYWKQADLHRRQLSMPTVYGDYIVVGDYEGYLHWLSKTDGRLLGRVEITDAPIIASPIVVDDIVYVYASDGTLAAVKVRLF